MTKQYYDRGPAWKIIVEEFLPQAPDTFSLADVIEWFRTRYPRFKKRSIRGPLRSMSANKPGAQEYRPGQAHDVLFELGKGLYCRYDAERGGLPGKLEKPVGEATKAMSTDKE